MADEEKKEVKTTYHPAATPVSTTVSGFKNRTQKYKKSTAAEPPRSYLISLSFSRA